MEKTIAEGGDKIVIGKEPFGVTVKEIKKVVAYLNHGAGNYRRDIRTGKLRDKESLKTLRFIEEQIKFMTTPSEEAVLEKFRAIYNRTKELEKSGIFSDNIGKRINQEFPEAYDGFFYLRRSDYVPRWCHSLEDVMQGDLVQGLSAESKKPLFTRLLGRFSKKQN
ncbi:hypothetical protein HY502_00415 [Candidatus Woesebacteria bacterium]|nr:hypothetical protein [Candidatus Woesebacteria bacterium]